MDKPFLMPVEDTMTITGRGTVATGRVERGVLKAGEQIEIVGHSGIDEERLSRRRWRCSAKHLDTVQAGDNAGILLRGVERKDIERGQVLAKPGSIKPHTKFEGEVYILEQRGGWSSHSISSRGIVLSFTSVRRT